MTQQAPNFDPWPLDKTRRPGWVTFLTHPTTEVRAGESRVGGLVGSHALMGVGPARRLSFPAPQPDPALPLTPPTHFPSWAFLTPHL